MGRTFDNEGDKPESWATDRHTTRSPFWKAPVCVKKKQNETRICVINGAWCCLTFEPCLRPSLSSKRCHRALVNLCQFFGGSQDFCVQTWAGHWQSKALDRCAPTHRGQGWPGISQCEVQKAGQLSELAGGRGRKWKLPEWKAELSDEQRGRVEAGHVGELTQFSGKSFVCLLICLYK